MDFIKENWELINEYAPIKAGTISMRLQYNKTLNPEYYKIVMSNEFGEIESEVIKVDYYRIGAGIILEYAFEKISSSINDIFGLEEDE